MATTTAKKPCAKCSKGGGVTTCDGCRQSFCTKHFVEHRTELSQQMNILSQDHQVFRRDMSSEIPKHPFTNRIDTWERESIQKIQMAAELARTDLRQLLDRTKIDLQLSTERLANELQICQQSDDFTENDLKRWTEQLKDLRKKLDAPISISIGNDDDIKSSIRLIRVTDKPHHHHYPPPPSSSRPTSSIPRATELRVTHYLKDCVYNTNEKFDEIDGKANLSDDHLLATCCLASVLTQPIIYGTNRYSSGKHQIRFRIEKMADLRLFFGIIRSLENISRSGHTQNISNNNHSLYGWWDLNETIINGKTQISKCRNIVTSGDDLTLTIDCENKLIQLQHHRTKRLAQLQIDLDKCPLPWKIVIRLQSAGDCVRIVQ